MPFPPIPVPYNAHHPYNPSYPYILGLEYTPIEEEVVNFLPQPTVEYGYRFRYEGYEWSDSDAGSETLSGGMPSVLAGLTDLLQQVNFTGVSQQWHVNLYPPNGEYAQGPVRTVTIPTCSFTATGNTAITSADTFNGTDPSPLLQFRYKEITDAAPTVADFAFDITGYRNLLKDKRILDVSLLYAGSVRDYAPEVTGLGSSSIGGGTIYRQVPITYDPQFRQYKYEPLAAVAFVKSTNLVLASADPQIVYTADGAPRGWGAMPSLIFQSSDVVAVPPDEMPIGALSLGNSIRMPGSMGLGNTTFEDYGEFNYELLETLHPGFASSARMVLRLFLQLPNTQSASVNNFPRLMLHYIGLKITYCDESRIGYSDITLRPAFPGSAGQVPRIMGNPLSTIDTPRWVYDAPDFFRTPIYRPGAFPKGNYTLTVTAADTGEDGGIRQRFRRAPLYVTRQLYQCPMLDCVQIQVPYPATSAASLGKTFTTTESTVMPKISLISRISGRNPLHRYNSHVYSRQIQSYIYGTYNASQKVLIESPLISGMTTEFPNIRFYARHHEGTSVPLKVQQDMDPGAVWKGLRTDYGGTVGYFITSSSMPSVTGDVDLAADFTSYGWMFTQEVVLAATATTGIAYGAALVANPTSLPNSTKPSVGLYWFDAGNNFNGAQLPIPSAYINSQMQRKRIRLRATLDVNNGAGGHTVSFYIATEYNTQWTLLGTVTTAGTTTVRAAPDTRFTVGSNFSQLPYTGVTSLVIHSAEYRTSIGGTVAANPIFEELPTGTTDFTDDAGAVWTRGGTVVTANLPTVWAPDAIPAAVITVAEFDQLEPLTTENWCQVDLRLDPPLEVPLGIPYLRWSSRGEKAGSRWEVLGASSWEPSGAIPGNFISQYPVGTYYSGDRGTYTGGVRSVGDAGGNPGTQNGAGLQWVPQLGPYATGNIDYRSDVSFLLAVDPPPVSGFVVTNQVQDLTGIATECGVDPCCVPRELDYLALAWDPPETGPDGSTAGRFKDTFDREVSGGWGDPDFGPSYTSFGLDTSLLSVADGAGYIATSPSVSGKIGVLAESGCGPNFDFTVSIRQLEDLVHLSEPVTMGLYGRYHDANNHYWIKVNVAPQVSGGVVDSFDDAIDEGIVLYFGKTIDGTETIIDSRQLAAIAAGYGSYTGVNIRWMMADALAKVKVWNIDHSEPLLWNIEAEEPFDVENGLLVEGGVLVPAACTTLNAPAVTGEVLDIRADIELADYSDSAQQWIVTCRTYGMLISADSIGFDWIDSGAVQTTQYSSPHGFVAGERILIRTVIDTDNGLGGYTITAYTAPADGTSLAGAIWVPVGSIVTSGGPTDFGDPSNPLCIGTYVSGLDGSLDGIIHAIQIRENGVLTVSVDFDIQEEGDDEFTDTTDFVWQVDASRGYILGTDESQFINSDGIGFFGEHEEGRAVLKFTDAMVTPPRYWFGYHEIQREDDDDPDVWQTIMKATNPALTTFNDYEARPGIATRYRIRRVDQYDFAGPWSPEVSGVIPAPGAGGDNTCLDDGHLLLFTTNEVQDGSSNLAYSSVWESGQVSEEFNFPDATVVQMQAMYDRDFYTAFRPLERAGEQFTRNVLVQAAAVSPAKVGNFTSLRDLSWSDINYVCVRDEAGNRWLASVTVPSGTVKRRRTLYIAPVNISEVTDTPTPVDPVWEP